PPPRDRSPPGRPSRRRCEPSELLVDLRRLAKLRQIVLSLLHHRLAREPVADLILHFRERPRSDLPAILHGDEMEPSVIAGDADQAGDLRGLQRKRSLRELRKQRPAPAVPQVASFMGGRAAGAGASHPGYTSPL